jgi:hypothetical protein
MMAAVVTYKVLDPLAPRKAADPNIRATAEEVAVRAARYAPVVTGRLAAGYKVEKGEHHAVYLVVNEVPYAIFVEYGTRFMRAEAPLGRAMAATRPA